MEQYKDISEHFAEDIYEAIDTVNCAKQRKSYGGPAPESVHVITSYSIHYTKLYEAEPMPNLTTAS